MHLKTKKTSGFTLTELMIALALNAVLFIALISIFIANLDYYRKTIQINRLNQQLQSAMDSMVNTIRRAGYWANAANDIGTGNNTNPFMATATDITVSPQGNCILLGYDSNDNGVLPAISSAYDDKRYGFRLNGNSLQERPPGAPFDCTASSNTWEDMTDNNVILITQFTVTLNQQTRSANAGGSIMMRSVDISLKGELKSDATLTKTLTEHVRIRNDKYVP
jgi:prepilin-type N-terminal cleavage/methylation domain-containing protein